MLESKIETHLINRVKEYGGEIRKLKFVGHVGAPDRLVLIPVQEGAFWVSKGTAKPRRREQSISLVELKQLGKPLRPSQAREHVRLAPYFDIKVLDSIEAIDAWLPSR